MPATRKRSLSPAAAILPPPKRRELLSNTNPHDILRTGLERLYDELIVHIFSYLSYADLCAAQAASRNWYRLASDNHIWKSLYLSAFGRTRLRGARGFVDRTDGREVRPLPGRARGHEDTKDWKWMFRISSNWRRGRCNVEQLHEPVEGDIAGSEDNCHVLLAGPLIISASAQITSSPAICIHKPRANSDGSPITTLSCPSSHNSPCSVTTLALDQSHPQASNTLSVVAFLSTGEFLVFEINHEDPVKSIRKLLYVPTHRRGQQRLAERTSPIVQAVYHNPLLISLSKTFQLSIYDLSDNGVQHMQTLSSYTSYPPTSFVLSTPTPTTYKLVMAYAIPVYPSHWTVGATELIISAHPPSSSSSSDSSDPPSPSSVFAPGPLSSPLTVVSSRTARALDVPPGFIDEHKLRLMREQWGRKVARVADTQTDGKWLVLAPAPREMSFDAPHRITSTSSTPPLRSSTTLQLYRLSLPSAPIHRPNSVGQSKITFVRYLEGQTSPVCALALADGRCVSLGMNGSIWVWDLENGTGAEVAAPASIPYHLGWQARPGSVVFDDRRIITADHDGIVVRRFDI
ncbi:F-box domain-containing protein [Pleurotus pulmonarius]